MQITVNKGVGFRMLKSINGFLQADNADEFFIQKANGHKYLRRIPKKSGKGYWYIYTETFKKPLQFLQQVFNISKERINTEFEENHIEKDYGANKQIYAAHILEKENIQNGHKIYSVEVMELEKNTRSRNRAGEWQDNQEIPLTSTISIPKSSKKSSHKADKNVHRREMVSPLPQP